MSRRLRRLARAVAATLALAVVATGRAEAQARGRPTTPSATVVPRARPSTDSVGRLYAPEMVQAQSRVTAADNADLVKAIEGKIRCTCGCNLDVFTCRTTDFNCATSPAMHRQVMARLDSGMTAPQILAAFETQYGQAVMMAPPRRGFNWAAYLMPFVGLGAGIAVVLLVMRRWIRARPRVPLGTESAAPGAPVPDEELERLQRELERFEA